MVKPPASRPRTSALPNRPLPRSGIGPGIRVEGEIAGDEDLLFEGQLRGSVELTSHALTIGPSGHVDATIVGRRVVIAGTLRGDVRAEEQIVLLSSADVEANLSAPRVSLEDGAQFRGGVDLGDGSGPAGSGSPPRRSRAESPEEEAEASGPVVDEQTRLL